MTPDESLAGAATDEGARRHHPVLGKFRRWEGWVDPDTVVNALGVRERGEYYSLYYELFDDIHTRRYFRSPPLAFDEEYFEWIDLLETVVDAREQYTMIELGAGFGRWIANAAAAVNQYSGVPYVLIAVEAEPQHFAWLEHNVRDNGLDLDRVRLINAAVAAVDGRGVFEIGNAYEYYGQALKEAAHDAVARAEAEAWNVDTISLTTLLVDLDRVDLVDADIQGAEADVFEAAAAAVDAKVKRVHIETHNRGVEKRLRVVFGELGWRKIWDFPSASDTETPYGVIHFEGGVQTWINPRFESAT